MRKTPIIILLFVFLLAVSVVSAAAEDMLEISEITVKVNGDHESADESGGTIKVPPASTLDLKVTVDNLFDKDVDDIEIENVEVEAVLEDIDDGDDMDETSDDKDIKAGRDATFNIEFEIPLRIDSDETFTLTVTATGEDDDGVEHTAEVVFDVESDKENHELRFLKKEISPETVSCTRSPRLDVRLINTGENDEDVEFSIENSALNYLVEQEFEMVEDIDDDDNEYRFEDTLNLANTDPGTYPFKVLAKYRDGREILEDTLNVIVKECEANKPKPEPEPEPEPEPPKTSPTTTTPTQPTTTTTTQPVVQYVPQPQPTVSTSQATAQPSRTSAVTTPRTSYSKKSWWDENKWVVLIVVTDVILLVAGIAIVLAVMRKRRG